MSTKKYNLIIVVTIFFIGLIITSASYAFWTWTSNTSKNVIFNTSNKLKKYVVYNEGESKFTGNFQVSNSFNYGTHSTISLYKKSEVSNIDLMATIHMNINQIGSNMRQSSALKWVVTSGTSSNIGTILASGNFMGVNNGDTLDLVTSLEVTTTETFYTIWIWLDASANPSDALSGETLDTNIWTEITQLEGTEDRFEVTRAIASYQDINATVVDTKYKVTNYAVTESNTTPSSWTSINSNDQNHVYNMPSYSASHTGTYYVWFKDSNNRTTSKSVTVTEIDTTAPTCTWGSWNKQTIGNNETATIKITCTDSESELAVNSVTTESVTKSNNKINVTGINKTKITNGYEITFTVTGTNSDGETTLTLPANTIKNSVNLGNTAVTSSAITVANTYTVSYANNNNNCILDSTAYASATKTYGTAWTIANPTCTGYDFAGWTASNTLDTTNAKYGNSENAVTTTWSNGSNPVTATWFKDLANRTDKTITLTATWTASELTFADKTITKSYSTSDQTETNGINAATNGSGTYTYAITGGNSNNYFTLSGRNLTIKANTPVNTSGYQITVRATDSVTGAYKDATYKIIINTIPATCPGTISNYNAAYDGNNHSISVSNDAVGGTVQYRSATSGTGSEWGTNKPSYKDFTNGAKTTYVRVAGDSNHSTVTCDSATVTITKKELTPSVNTCNNKTYDGTTSASCTFTLATIVTGEDVSASGTCTFANKNVGTGKNVSCTGISLGGNDKGNYSLSSTSASKNSAANITAKTLTITAIDQTIAYGGSIETGIGQTNVSGLVSGDSLTAITLTPSTNNVTTTGKITPSAATIKDNGGNGNEVTSNYSITYTDGNLTITAVSATCPTIDNYSGAYDGANHTISVGNNAVGGTVKYRTATSGTGSTWTETNPTYKDYTNGAKTVYVEVEGDANHTTKTCGSKTVTITKRNLTPTVNTCSNRAYDGTTTASCTFNLATVVTGETVTASGACTFADKNVGTGKNVSCSNIALGGSDKDNYALSVTTASKNSAANITTRAVTIKAKNQSIAYGGSIATGTNQVEISSGSLASGDAISNITLTASTNNVTTNGTITPSAATIKDSNGTGTSMNSNYTISYATGNLTITSVAATCPTTSGYNGVYDGSNHSITVGNDAVGGTVKYRTTSNGEWTETKPSYKDFTNGAKTVYVEVEGDSNHTTKDCGSKTVTITKKELTSTEITAWSQTWSSTSSTYTRTGVSTGIGSETVSLVYTPYSNTVMSYTYSASAAAGKFTLSLTNNNYYISSAGNFTLTGAEITGSVSISGTARWGETLTANASCTTPSSGCTFTYKWYANGTEISGATSRTYVIAKEHVGKTITVKATASANNYANKTLTSSATNTIAKQDLVVNVVSYSNEYDGNTHYATIKVTSSEWDGAKIVSGTTTSYGTDVVTNGLYNVAYNLKPGYSNYTNGAKTVYYKVTGGTYYNDITGSTTVNITKKQATITLTDTSVALTYKTSGSNNYTYDGDGTVTCSSSNQTYVTCSVDTTNHKITVVPVKKTSSAITITVSASAGDNYSAATNKTFTVTVAAFTPTVTLTAKSEANRTYTGNPIEANTATVTLTNNETYTGGITYTYYTNNSCSAGATFNAPTNGNYWVIASISASGNYNAASSSCVNHNIVEATPTVSLSAKTGMIYNGSSQAANTATVSPDGGGAITYKYYTNNNCSSGESSTAPTNAGNYWVKASVAAVSGKTNAASSSCIAHTISPKELTSSQITAWTTDWVSGATTYTRNNVSTGVGTEKVNLVYTPKTNAVGTYTYSATAGTGKFTLSQTNNNYTISGAGNLTLSAISATCPTLNNYSGTYDGNDHTISVGNDAVGGTVKYRTSTTGSWSTTNPAYSDFTNGAKTVYVEVEGDSNHSTIDCGSKTVTITKKALTPSASASNKTYDGGTSASCTITLSGIVSGDTVTATATGAFDNKNVGTGKTVTCSSITLAGADAGNYSVTSSKTTTANITAKGLTITAKAQSIYYGGSIATGVGQVTTSGLVSGDSLTAISLAASTTNVTTSGKITPSAATIKDNSGSGSTVTSNYSITYNTGTLTITAISATCPTLDNYSGTYDGNDHTISVGNDAVGGTVKYRTSTTGSWSTTNPAYSDFTNGAKTVYVEVEGDSNHSTIDCGSKTVTITKKALTPSASASNKTYDGGTSASCTITLSGIVSGDIVTASATGTFDNKNVGTGKTVTCSSITLAGADAGNYSVTSSKTTTANITAKAATITAKNQTITYGGSIATGIDQVTTSGLVSGDSLTAITLTPSTSDYTTSGTVTPSAATIKDSNESGTDVTGNYSITYSNGTLSIGKKSLTPSVNTCSNKTYDGNTTASCTISLSGVQSGDTVTASGTCVFANKSAGTGKNVSCSSITLGGADKGNYSLSTTSASKNSAADITQKVLTITAKNQSITYGGSITTGTGQVTSSGLISGDSLTTITLTPSTSDYTTSGAITPSAATIKDSNGSGTAVTSNYSITYADGTLTIGKKSLTPSVNTCSNKTYDGNATASCTISLSGIKSGDTVTASGTCVFADKNAGTGKNVSCTDITLAGASAGNYSLSTTSASKNSAANITAKALTSTEITAYSTDWASGATTYTRSNVGTGIGSETVTLVYTPRSNTVGSYTYSATAGDGKYTLAINPANSNYSISSAANFTINDSQGPTVNDIGGGTTLKTGSQSVTLKCSDDVGVTAYYWGTTEPTSASAVSTTTAANITSLTSTNGWSQNVTAAGTYWLACKDAAGHYAKKSIVIRKYQVQAVLEKISGNSNTTYTSTYYENSGSAATYYVKEGTTLTLANIYTVPTGGDTFKGYSTQAPASTARTLSTTAPTMPANNTTVYYMWFTRARYTVTVTKQTNGKTVASTVTQTSNSVTVNAGASSNGTLTVKYGDTVTATATANTGYSFSSWSGGYISGSTNPTTGGAVTADKTITAGFTGNEYTATFKYQSNGTSGSTTVSTATESCTVSNSSGNCTINIPSAVTGSVGTYNNEYAGLATSTGTMSTGVSKTATTITLSASGTYYATYSTPVTFYYPDTMSTCTSDNNYYRNQWFSNNTTLASTVISDSQTGTSNFDIDSSVLTTSISSYTLRSVQKYLSNTGVGAFSSAVSSNLTTFYIVLQGNITGTFYYNSSTANNGTYTVATATATAIRYVYCKTVTTTGQFNGTYTAPTAAANSVGPYGEPLYGWRTTDASYVGANSINASYTKAYAIYSQEVTNYYYSSSYTSRTLYRRSFFPDDGDSINENEIVTVLSNSNSGTGSVPTSYQSAIGPGNSSWYGLAQTATTTREYSTFAAATNSTATTLYTIYSFHVNYNKGSHVSSIGSNSGVCYVTTSDTSCTVTLPSITASTGYTSVGWSTTDGATAGTAAGSSYELTTSGGTLYANAVGNEYTATFYYNSNTTSGSLTAATKTASCTVSNTDGNCTVSVPSEVSSSVGKYNSAYHGVVNATSNMGTTSTITLTGNATYYANYSSALTIYYPTSASALSSSSTALYRNEYFTSTSAMGVVTATANNSTTQASSVTLSGLFGTLSGINATINNTTSGNIKAINSDDVKQTNTTTYYAVTTNSETYSIVYNSNATCGSFTKATDSSGTVTSTYYINTTSSLGVNHGSVTYSPSSTVSNSVGKYNSAYKGISSSSTGITNVTSCTGGSTYYAYYSTGLSITYLDSATTTSSSSALLYRNEYFSSTTDMTTLTATSQTSTTQATSLTISGLYGSLAGLATANNSTTTYAVNNAANVVTPSACTTTYYAVSTYSVTYSMGAHVSSIGTSTGEGINSCKATTSAMSCSVTLPSITANTGYTPVGWSTINGAATGADAGSSYELTSTGDTLYGNASDETGPSGSVTASLSGTTISVTATVSDTGSGLATTDTYGWKLVTSTICDSSITDFVVNTNSSYTFTVSTEGVYYVCVRPRDEDGNYSYLLSNEIIYAYNPYESYSCANTSTGTSPYALTYTGNCTMSGSSSSWKVKFTTSGTLTFRSNFAIDAFLVGGGGGAGVGWGSGGGGGGYTTTGTNITPNANQGYTVTIGAGGAASTNRYGVRGSTGGTTSALGYSAAGGQGGNGCNSSNCNIGQNGGNGGSGGSSYAQIGGSNGANGVKYAPHTSLKPGTGCVSNSGCKVNGATCTNTTEFCESSGTVYAGGGSGATQTGAAAGGGGKSGSAGTANTGGGGGAKDSGAGAGGSGVVVIRKTTASFQSQVLSSGTIYTAYTSNSFTGVAGDSNGYTYTIKSGAPSGATIDSANRTISFPDTTNAGKYNVIVTATNSTTGSTMDATMTININLVVNPLYSYSCANASAGSSPYMITYTGNCSMTGDSTGWKLKLLNNGTITFNTTLNIDAFLVGGGGGAGVGWGAGGGGGGYTTTQKNMTVNPNDSFAITIGAGGAASTNRYGVRGSTGGTTTAFGYSAAGGQGGNGCNSENCHIEQNGGNGGSGGSSYAQIGGSNGANGVKYAPHTSLSPGTGCVSNGGCKLNGSTCTNTTEFCDSSGVLYAGGGSGAEQSSAASGGGGRGGHNGTANTGGGGGADNSSSGAGGSGVVVLRNQK